MQTIGIAGFFNGHLVLIKIADLFLELAHIVIGNHQGLPDVTASLVAQVLGHIELLGKLTLPRPVTEAVEQVPGHHDFRDIVLGGARNAAEILALVTPEAQIKPGLIGATAGSQRGVGRAHVFDGRAQGRIAVLRQFDGARRIGRDVLDQRRGQRHLGRRHGTHNALEPCRCIVQVGRFGKQV